MATTLRGIAGLKGREPVGAVLTVGTKGPTGAPIERDRLWIKSPDQDASGGRPAHPAFAAFNSAKPEARRSINGVIVHADIDDCFEHALKAQKLKGHESHPRGVPTCHGDGVRAIRFVGIDKPGADAQGFREIPCPHEACEFRQGPSPACKPALRFLFRPAWKDGATLPTPLMKLVSHSWNTARNFVGMFDYLRAQAAALGVAHPSFYGLTFSLALGEKTNAAEKSRFPVLSISPTTDVQRFLATQRQALEDIRAGQRLLASLRDDSPETIALDSAEIRPGIPAIVDAEGASGGGGQKGLFR